MIYDNLEERLKELHLEIIENNGEILLLKDKYGFCKMTKSHIRAGYKPDIRSALDKNSYFINKVLEIFPDFLEYNTMLSDYTKRCNNILFNTKYGVCKITPGVLLNGSDFSILAAVNKTEYFKNLLFDNYPNYINDYIIIGEYKDKKSNILVNTKYGLCQLTPDNLLRGAIPTIKSAINKTEFFINQAKEIHGDKYDYSLVEYKSAKTKILIICEEHDIFEQTPDGHLSDRGCPICGYGGNWWEDSVWVDAGKTSKNFDSFKCYIIRCWNNKEEFYKIGKTYLKVNQRFPSNLTMPYNYEIVQLFIDEGLIISKLEKNLIKENREFKYLPKIKFGGYSECFSKIHQSLNKIKNLNE